MFWRVVDFLVAFLILAASLVLAAVALVAIILGCLSLFGLVNGLIVSVFLLALILAGLIYLIHKEISQ